MMETTNFREAFAPSPFNFQHTTRGYFAAPSKEAHPLHYTICLGGISERDCSIFLI